MALIQIRCPHCEEEITIRATFSTKEYPKGPKPTDPGIEVDNLIIEMVREGTTYGKMAKVLMSRGILTPGGKKTWYPSTVFRGYKQALKRREARGEK